MQDSAGGRKNTHTHAHMHTNKRSEYKLLFHKPSRPLLLPHMRIREGCASVPGTQGNLGRRVVKRPTGLFPLSKSGNNPICINIFAFAYRRRPKELFAISKVSVLFRAGRVLFRLCPRMCSFARCDAMLKSDAIRPSGRGESE